ncbi:MAG: tetratricopeptide repeat protein, partial [Verrucomicrobiota bacterium]|nr:tetratricopeptide repeat protein [Verrucomicrobiota bacterium]
TLTPDYPSARNGLAQVLYQQGKKEEAQSLLGDTTAAASLAKNDYPRTWLAALSLARVQNDQRDVSAALETLARARLDYPRAWEIISFQSELLRETEGPAAALGPIEDFEQKNWWHFRATLALGRLYAEQGDASRAEITLRKASRLDVYDVEALNLIAFLHLNQSRLADACQAQRRAVARQPDQPRQYLMLADILKKMGRTEEANETAAQVTRLKGVAEAHLAAN